MAREDTPDESGAPWGAASRGNCPGELVSGLTWGLECCEDSGVSDENPYSPPQVVESQTVETTGRVVAGFKNLLVLCVLVLVLIAGGNLWQIGVLVVASATGGGDMVVWRVHEVLSRVAQFAGGILFLVWFYRTACNARLFHGRQLNQSPGAAVGSFLIPLVNLVMPCSAACEIYSATFTSLGRKSPTWLVICWWLTFIISGVLLNLPMTTIEGVAAVFGFRLVAVGFLIGMMVTLTVAQGRVGRSADQHARIAAAAAGPGPLPPGKPMMRRPAPVPGAPVGAMLPPRHDAPKA